MRPLGFSLRSAATNSHRAKEREGKRERERRLGPLEWTRCVSRFLSIAHTVLGQKAQNNKPNPKHRRKKQRRKESNSAQPLMGCTYTPCAMHKTHTHTQAHTERMCLYKNESDLWNSRSRPWLFFLFVNSENYTVRLICSACVMFLLFFCFCFLFNLISTHRAHRAAIEVIQRRNRRLDFCSFFFALSLL